jgi:Uma2 family endonuclease
MADMGLFEGRRVELIDGEIVEMAAQKNFHLAAITLTAEALKAAFGPGHWIRVQGSLDLSLVFVPDPDVAVVPGDPRGCSADNPTTALLVVEVSDTTLAYDRRTKGSLYARAGITDYWIINLLDDQLEIYRDPTPDPAQPAGFGYATSSILGPNDVASPLAAPQATLRVADLFP